MANLRGSTDLKLGTIVETLKLALSMSTNENDLRQSIKSIVKLIESKLPKIAKPLLTKMPT